MKSKANRIFNIPAKRFAFALLSLKMLIILTTRMGFEPTRAQHIGLAVQRLNHSATSSAVNVSMSKDQVGNMFWNLTIFAGQLDSELCLRLLEHYMGRSQASSKSRVSRQTVLVRPSILCLVLEHQKLHRYIKGLMKTNPISRRCQKVGYISKLAS